MKKGTKMFIGMVIFMAIFMSSYVLAVESTLIIKLQREINASLAKVNSIRTNLEQRIAQIEEQRKRVLEEIQSTPFEDIDRRLYLAGKYYNLRAQRLKLEAEATAKQLKLIEGIIMRFKKLGKIIESDKTLPINLEKEKEQVRNMMLGARTLFYELARVYPNDPSLEMMAYSLATKEASLREYYKNNKPISVRERLNYFIDCASYMRMVLNFYKAERDRILEEIYRKIVRKIVKGYDENLHYGPKNVVKTYQRLHEDDLIVQNSLKESFGEPSVNYPDLNYPEFGDW